MEAHKNLIEKELLNRPAIYSSQFDMVAGPPSPVGAMPLLLKDISINLVALKKLWQKLQLLLENGHH